MSVIDRLGNVVKSEWNSRFRGKDGDDKDAKDQAEKEALAEVDAALKRTAAATTTTTTATSSTSSTSSTSAPFVKPPRVPQVTDVKSALALLELMPNATLDEVRARYRALAKQTHPKTQSGRTDERNHAHLTLESLTDALEVLEEHLLPLPATSLTLAGK